MGLLQRVSKALGVMNHHILDQDGVVGDFQGDAALGFWNGRQACASGLQFLPGLPAPEQNQVWNRGQKAFCQILQVLGALREDQRRTSVVNRAYDVGADHPVSRLVNPQCLV